MTCSSCRVIVNLGAKIANLSETTKFLQKKMTNISICNK